MDTKEILSIDELHETLRSGEVGRFKASLMLKQALVDQLSSVESLSRFTCVKFNNVINDGLNGPDVIKDMNRAKAVLDGSEEGRWIYERLWKDGAIHFLSKEEFETAERRSKTFGAEHLQGCISYHVVNTVKLGLDLRFFFLDQAYKSFFKNFYFNSYLWVGYSRGGLHMDLNDNVLVQLSGRKTIVFWSARDSEEVFQKANHLSSTGRKTHPNFPPNLLGYKEFSATGSYHVVHLDPGDAVAIPGGAYHSLNASHDSISINFFMIPNLCASKKYWPWHPRMLTFKSVLYLTCINHINRVLWRIFGRSFIRDGLYDRM